MGLGRTEERVDACVPEGFARCPVDVALGVLGKKWTPLIIRNLLRGDRHFNQLVGNIPGLTPKILSTRLKDLEHDGLLVKHVSSQKPVQIDYVLTEKGYAMLPILRQMVRWALTYAPDLVLGSSRKPKELEKAIEAWQAVVLHKDEHLVLERRMDVVMVRWVTRA